ncbi:MAG: thiosulfate/3-mercaptopyruvate sulfurtransferase [Gammaproteobacteria bacterium]|jgi:thiosulfate/3-mercaptopyruvate sulfurtransferase
MKLIQALVLLAVVQISAIVHAQPLVDGDWLASRLGDQSLVVLDIRNKIDGGSAAEYTKGHIPGAVHSDYLKAGWRTTDKGVVGMLPPVVKLEALIGGLGIGNDSHVVIVPGGVSAADYGSATRVYWTLKYLGHDRVSILNGGHALWREQQRSVESGAVAPRSALFKAQPRPELLATRDDVSKAVAEGGALIDNRPTTQFLGRAKHGKAKRAGAIPTAHNIPQGQFFDANSGQFSSVESLRKLWRDDDLDGDGAITYCNTGHWASLGWFTSSELLGRKNTRMYDGSMVEWSADESLPMINTAK